MDDILVYANITGELVMLYVLFTRPWSTLRFFSAIQVLQFLELPILLSLPPTPFYYAWFAFDKANVLLELCCVYEATMIVPDVALLLAIHSAIKLVSYADADLDSMLAADGLYYARAILNVFISFYIAFRLYERRPNANRETAAA